MSNQKEQIARFEFKYVLDPVTVMRVRDFIESVGLEHDRNTPVNPYTVTSLYFDSVGLDDYYDKAGGFLVRKKVRIRAYASALHHDLLDLYFEIKNKHDMFISKDRAVISKKEWEHIVEGNFRGLFPLFDYYLFREGRVPTVIVRYEREAFDAWFYGRVRLTFDKHIEAIRPDASLTGDDLWYDATPVSGPMTVMEVKFAKRLPWWFLVMVEKFGLERVAYSKYAHAVDALYRYNPLPR